MKKLFLLIPVLLVFTFGSSPLVWAHGVNISHATKSSIEITAVYDTGEPMSEAQVAVFAPNDPARPWKTGVCDQEGRFSFTPDPSQPGVWDVQVRKAGHGGLIHIDVGTGGVSSDRGGFSWPQKALMAVCVLWGLAGAALYFVRRKS